MILLFSVFFSVVSAAAQRQQAAPIVFCDPHINDEMCEVRAIVGCFFLNGATTPDPVKKNLTSLDQKRYDEMRQDATLLSNLVPRTSLLPNSAESIALYQAFIDNLASPQFDVCKNALKELVLYARLDRKKIDAIKQKLSEVRKDLADFPEALLSVQLRRDFHTCVDQFEQDRKAYQAHCSHKQALQTLCSTQMVISSPVALASTLSDLQQCVVGYGEDKFKHDVRSCLVQHVIETLPTIVLIRQLGDTDLQGSDLLLVYLNKSPTVKYFAVLEEAVPVVNQFGPFVQLTTDLTSTLSPADKKKAVVGHVRDSLLTVQQGVQSHWTIVLADQSVVLSPFIQKFDAFRAQNPISVFEVI